MENKKKWSLFDVLDFVRVRMAKLIADKRIGEVNIKIHLATNGGIGKFEFGFIERVK